MIETKDFVEFPKIARYNRIVIVTEKIDGTNAQILITEDGGFFTGSRTRWITPKEDNHGFSAWAHEHKDELMALGVGRHFGEWWGSGIQRGYDLPKGEKRFSLFNTIRWCEHGNIPRDIPNNDPRIVQKQDVLPPCVCLVPVLWSGLFGDLDVDEIMANLLRTGSMAAPGFMRPEGIVIFHSKANIGFKKTFEKDNTGKWDV